MTTQLSPDATKRQDEIDRKLLQNVMVPKWAFHVMVGFVYLSTLCAVLSVFVLIGLMVKVSTQANLIRANQLKSAARIDAVVEEAKEIRQDAREIKAAKDAADKKAR